MNRWSVVRSLVALFALAAVGCSAEGSSTEVDESEAEIYGAHYVGVDGEEVQGDRFATSEQPLMLNVDPSGTAEGPHPEPWKKVEGPHPEPWQGGGSEPAPPAGAGPESEAER